MEEISGDIRFVFSGFLESGKTNFYKRNIREPQFFNRRENTVDWHVKKEWKSTIQKNWKI